MKLEEILVLLPCHSLEDFPLYHEKEAAEGLLSAWTAIWHPELIASVGGTPGWARADNPPSALAGRLLVIPEVSENLLAAGWVSRAKTEGAAVIRKLHLRHEVLSAALATLADDRPRCDPILAQDFLALGYCYLQVELLTRQMRYMSNLDLVHFRQETVAAAQAAVAGDTTTARTHLQKCFDVLMEARERFYPSQAYLIDLTLVAATTIGDALRQDLHSASPRNLVVSAEVVVEMATRQPATLEALRQALGRNAVALVGGERSERELPLLPLESILSELQQGQKLYQDHLGSRAEVFGRRRFGITPALPQLLARSGFVGAVHATLDDGQFPKEGQSKTRWQGLDSSAIDALVRVPLDANRAESFLGFPTKMGETMDLDHVATLAFAHWPGQVSPWYDDLKRILTYAPVLGKFVTISDYFAHTDAAGHLTRFTADQYRAPYLKQAIIRRQPDPLSRFARHCRLRATADAQQAIDTLASLLTGKTVEPDDLADEIERAAAAGATVADTASAAGSFEQRLQQRQAAVAGRFAAALPRAQLPAAQGYLVLNPQSFTRRVGVDVTALESLPAMDGPVKAVQAVGERKLASVEVPAMGYAWVAAGKSAGRKTADKKPMAEGTTLRNEHFEVVVDPVTGGIRSVHDYKHRDNRLSQQVALRLPGPRPKPGDVWQDPDEQAIYSVMAADGVEVTSAGPVYGEIVSRGRLVDLEGRKLAGFRQTFQAWRGSPVLIVEIELEVTEEPRADPWNSYYAARFAWADSAADLWRSVQQTCQPTSAKRLEATDFVEVRSADMRTAILAGGWPYHRRCGLRKLDSLLVVRGETARKFRLGIGIDLPHPIASAIEFISPPLIVEETSPPPSSAVTSWLCHVDARNVVSTQWEPLVADGRVCGFRVRLLETEGRAGRVRLRSFRPLTSAQQVDFQGGTLASLSVEEGVALIDLTAFEWAQVEAKWT